MCEMKMLCRRKRRQTVSALRSCFAPHIPRVKTSTYLSYHGESAINIERASNQLLRHLFDVRKVVLHADAYEGNLSGCLIDDKRLFYFRKNFTVRHKRTESDIKLTFSAFHVHFFDRRYRFLLHDTANLSNNTLEREMHFERASGVA